MIQTYDQLITNQLLHQLRYAAKLLDKEAALIQQINDDLSGCQSSILHKHLSSRMNPFVLMDYSDLVIRFINVPEHIV